MSSFHSGEIQKLCYWVEEIEEDSHVYFAPNVDYDEV